MVVENRGSADHNALGILIEENMLAQPDGLNSHPAPTSDAKRTSG
ncbi:hypothetical protein [Pseudomonas benzenivorans]